MSVPDATLGGFHPPYMPTGDTTADETEENQPPLEGGMAFNRDIHQWLLSNIVRAQAESREIQSLLDDDSKHRDTDRIKARLSKLEAETHEYFKRMNMFIALTGGESNKTT